MEELQKQRECSFPVSAWARNGLGTMYFCKRWVPLKGSGKSPSFFECISLRRLSVATTEDGAIWNGSCCTKHIISAFRIGINAVCVNLIQHAAGSDAGPAISESSPGLLPFAAALPGLQQSTEALRCQVYALGSQLASRTWDYAKFALSSFENQVPVGC